MSNQMSLMLYYSVFFISALFAHVIEKKDRLSGTKSICYFRNGIMKIYSKKMLLWFAMMFFPVYIATIRYGIGTDYTQYKVFFYRNSAINLNDLSSVALQPTEVISNVIYKIAYILFGDFQGYLFITSLITIWVAFVAMHYYSNEISFFVATFSYFCLCYAPSLNIIRQMMAVSVVFYGLRYITNKKLIKYLITILVATLFHTTAIFGVLFYFLRIKNDKNVKIRQIGMIIVCLSFPIFFGSIFELFTSLSLFRTYYGFFYSTDFGFLHVTDIVFRLPIAIVIIVFRKKLEARNEVNYFFELLFLMEFVSLMLTSYNKWLYRLMYYCIPGEIVLVSQFPQCVPLRDKQIVRIGVVFYYAAFFFLNNYVRGVDEIFPFVSIYMK
ncbi:MAG: EpsG family protein [Dorea sp.]|jgi:transmembrane protein EpsG|nr:EpsG family protein [Dorea sp.]